jgi:hypothetical protein
MKWDFRRDHPGDLELLQPECPDVTATSVALVML